MRELHLVCDVPLVKRAALTMRRSLPFFPYEQTSAAPARMSQKWRACASRCKTRLTVTACNEGGSDPRRMQLGSVQRGLPWPRSNWEKDLDPGESYLRAARSATDQAADPAALRSLRRRRRTTWRSQPRSHPRRLAPELPAAGDGDGDGLSVRLVSGHARTLNRYGSPPWR
jgi:hypothetical protein